MEKTRRSRRLRILVYCNVGFNRHQISPMQSEGGLGGWRPGAPGSGGDPFLFSFCFCFFFWFISVFFLFFSRKKQKNRLQKNRRLCPIRQTAPQKKTRPRNSHRLPPKKHWVGRPGETDSVLAVS